ncbi:probable NCA-3 calcium P-type ATPase NCA-3 (Ca2+-transporting ATPase) [Cephalotrichum gorgonifer]|uniref:Calcium-transporting ATPase n=1 Tax=Cephalotrichum gorgonifer TaxID=2041049 RepID=A0AAE8MRC2_9PEZI|nr:probable NCA-3 calcium P-type ATPase NCA-3 (Ca2+-transporting ATPase) [Cephalotrichum gorgonifer]
MASNDAPLPDKGIDNTPPIQSSIEGTDQKLINESDTNNGHAHDVGHHESAPFKLDLEDALTPDPGTEDMFHTEGNTFAFSAGQLSKLLNPKSLNAFYALGGLAGLEKGLRTDRKSGLSVDEVRLDGSVPFDQVATKGASPYGALGNTMPTLKEGAKASVHIPPPEPVKDTEPFADRKRAFRDNRLPEKKPRSIFQLAWIAYNDKVLILLTAAAVVSLALGLYQTFAPQQHKPGEKEEPKVEWVEGVAILVAIIVVVLVTTVNDWQMERQFNSLNKKNSTRSVKVVRSGQSVEISVFDILVGDVMHLETGDVIPVDGIFIDGHGIKCDESSATGESDLLKKVPADQVYQSLQALNSPGAHHEEIEKLDPFIISGSQVNEGTGTFLVTAVGVHSSYGRTTMSLRTEQEDTPLQMKLSRLANSIAKFGGGAALLLFVVLFIKFLANLPHNHASPREKGQEFLDIFIVAVTVVVVAVPEGLPLAVTLALAFATTRMMKDNNLVRILKACETMGNATTICSDKTGTLTQNKMTVVAATLGKGTNFGGDSKPPYEPAGEGNHPNKTSESSDGPIPTASSAAKFAEGLSDEMKELLVQSNAVNSTAFEGDQNGEKTFIGSKTEVALLTLCRDYFGAGPVQEERSNANVVDVVPFDSKLKYMATVVKLPNGKFRAYVKGASEIVLASCTKVLTSGSSSDLTTTDLAKEDSEMFKGIITSYATQSLRTIGSSFRDFDSWPPKEYSSGSGDSAASFSTIHAGMTLVAIYGIKDPLRESVVGAIKDCQKAGVIVRMVTGDNILTGTAIARECGIYHPEEGGTAMEGPDFRRLSDEERKEKIPKLQVLARSSPEDKRILVRTLKELGETVAVTGDGTNDAPALKMADIGFSMGIAGTEVAKEASDIILMDDNFSSIVKGMMWGRAVNDSVKKFLQFQLTVNITAVVLTFVTAVASDKGESVLNAVQLLWVNLIMDTFAALALATDPPSPSVLDRKPERKSAPLVNARMGKMIIGQAICQLAIAFTLHFGGSTLLGYDLSNDTEYSRHKTLVFNTFVWLQIFNEVNNRRLDNKLNIFEGIQRNYFFLIMNVIMIGGQVLIIFKGGEAFQIKPLNGKEWGMSIGLGAISIPWGAVIRLTPDSWIEKIVSILPKPPKLRWKKKTKASKEEAGEVEKQVQSDEQEFKPPPKSRTLSMIRGRRATEPISRRRRMRIYKERVSGAGHRAMRKLDGGSSTGLATSIQKKG